MNNLISEIAKLYTINHEKAEKILSQSIITEYMIWYELFLRNKRWVKARNVLYQLCEEHPEHSDDDWIVAKIWLIGRSYAAAVERVRDNDYLIADDFYYDKVAQNLYGKFGEELDAHIIALKSAHNLEEKLPVILAAHQMLTSKLFDITGLDKRSLASKYLHFHIPNCFYIYDSRASKTISLLVKKRKSKSLYLKELYDEKYYDFVCRMILLQQYLSESLSKGFEPITPRFLDSFLLYIHNQHLK